MGQHHKQNPSDRSFLTKEYEHICERRELVFFQRDFIRYSVGIDEIQQHCRVIDAHDLTIQ